MENHTNFLFLTHYHRLYVSFSNDLSRFTWIFPLKSKGDVVPISKQFIYQVKNLYDKRIKIVICDEGWV